MKIYLDNCCFNRPFDDQTQLSIYLETQAKLFVQQKIISKEYSLVWSYILEFENKQNPFEFRRDTIIKWKSIADTMVYENEEIILLAEKMYEKGVKAKDALHISSALYAKSKYFLTTDKKLLNKNKDIEDITIINPIDFTREMEG